MHGNEKIAAGLYGRKRQQFQWRQRQKQKKHQKQRVPFQQYERQIGDSPRDSTAPPPRVAIQPERTYSVLNSSNTRKIAVFFRKPPHHYLMRNPIADALLG